MGRPQNRRGGGRGRPPASTARRPPRPEPKGLGGEQVEGRQAVRELLVANRRRVHEVWLATEVEPAPILGEIEDLAGRRRVPVRRVGRKRLDDAARTDAPQGVLARAAAIEEADLDDLLSRQPGKPAPFLIALDGVTDPGNLGAVLRSAACAGATGVVLPRHRSVHVTPAVTKAAAGAVEWLPIALAPGLPTALQRMKTAGVWSVGLDPEGERDIFTVDLGAEPVALILGAEGQGLSRLVRARCDVLARIPLSGAIASLNVAAAAAVACFAIRRGR
jgi:23S rRNA (guanosine2251-2'-O)-methyltransferase